MEKIESIFLDTNTREGTPTYSYGSSRLYSIPKHKYTIVVLRWKLPWFLS